VIALPTMLSVARPRGFSALLGRWAGMVSLPIFFLVWQAVSMSGAVNPMLFPAPTTVVAALWQWIVAGPFLSDLGMSASRLLVGFIGGALVGALTGVLTGATPLAAALLGPVFQLLRPIPPIALVPVVVLWFGLSEWGKWFLVFWGVFFTVWMAAHLGIRQVDQNLVRAAQCLGAPRRALLVEVLLPAALPTVLVGLRTAVSVSFYTLVAAELAGTFSGLAYRIEIAHQNMQTGQMLGGLLVLGGLSSLADRGFALASRRLVWWGGS
jgi:ABC-type nitrate/sulfonate/bicarbonate transport system permease component